MKDTYNRNTANEGKRESTKISNSKNLQRKAKKKGDYDYETTYYREILKRYEVIEKKASERFDYLISLTCENIDSSNQIRYENSKEAFIRIIHHHFKTNKIIVKEIPNKKFSLTGLMKTKITAEINKVTDEKIENVIDAYVAAVLSVLTIVPTISSKLLKEINLRTAELTDYKTIAEKKLKRNLIKPERLNIYKKIINKIAEAESRGFKSNTQSICEEINADSEYDLRKAFDQWKKNNKTTFKQLMEDAKLKWENQKK
ncbi:MAG: hypothetical protein ACYCVH_06225 [Ignavibacteriaceae bacterium]